MNNIRNILWFIVWTIFLYKIDNTRSFKLKKVVVSFVLVYDWTTKYVILGQEEQYG